MNELLEQLKYWRAERPDEWKMDEFLRLAEDQNKRIAELGQELESARFFQVDVIRCLNKIAWEHNHSEIPQYMNLARGCILKIEAQQAKQLKGGAK